MDDDFTGVDTNKPQLEIELIKEESCTLANMANGEQKRHITLILQESTIMQQLGSQPSGR